MKILVSGGAGFIGSHTIVELLNNGYDVVCVDNFCNSKEGVIDKIKLISGKDFKFYKCDVCDFEQMNKIFEKEKIDCVIHFASLKSGAESIINPGLYYSNNINSTFVIATLMEKYCVDKIIFSSSATVYGNSRNVPIKETEEIGNVISPYGLSKYLNELYLKNRSENNKKYKAIALRYFNPIGAHPSGIIGEDAPNSIPNNLMLYLLDVADGKLPFLNIFGCDYDTPDGSGIRDFVHVVDLARGHVAALKYFKKMENYYEVFNLGTGTGHTVLELVKTFERVNHIHIPIKISQRRPGDVDISFASVEKANNLLNFKCIYDLDDCMFDSWKFKINSR